MSPVRIPYFHYPDGAFFDRKVQSVLLPLRIEEEQFHRAMGAVRSSHDWESTYFWFTTPIRLYCWGHEFITDGRSSKDRHARILDELSELPNVVGSLLQAIKDYSEKDRKDWTIARVAVERSGDVHGHEYHLAFPPRVVQVPPLKWDAIAFEEFPGGVRKTGDLLRKELCNEIKERRRILEKWKPEIDAWYAWNRYLSEHR